MSEISKKTHVFFVFPNAASLWNRLTNLVDLLITASLEGYTRRLADVGNRGQAKRSPR